MMKRVRELNSKYYLPTNKQTQIISEPVRALRDRPQGESAEGPTTSVTGSTQSTWSQVAFKLIAPGTCRPCILTLSIE